MRKIFALVICLIFLTSCAKNENSATDSKQNPDSGAVDRTNTDVEFESGNNYFLFGNNIDNVEFPIDTPIITTNETAKAIAEAILLDLQSRGRFPDVALYSIYHDTDDDIYYFDYWITPEVVDGEIIYTTGGGLTIAIDAKTCQVLKMWPGE